MKILAAFVAGTSISLASGFQVAPTKPGATTALHMGFLDNMFKNPLHGGGSGSGHYDEMMREEKELLKARKASHLTKGDLKKKYAAKHGWLEDVLQNAFHGHGSANDKDLEEMYKTQQQVLYERREYVGRKDQLRNKYKNPAVDHLKKDIKTIAHDPAVLNKKEDDAMYIDESGPGFRFPWD